MRTRTLVGLALVASFAHAIDSVDLNPLHLGDTRTFHVDHPQGIRPLVVIDVTQSFGSWYKVENHPLTDGSAWFTNNDPDAIAQWVQGHAEVIIETDAALHHSWSFSSTNSCHTTTHAQLVDTQATYVTPAGTFSGCYVYDIQGNCRGAGVTQIVMAPGVGLVGWDAYHLLGTIEMRLMSATVGGQTYPQTFPSLAFEGTTDRPVYTHGGGAPGSPPTSATITVQGKLSNNLSQDFDFWQSGQELEVTVTAVGGSAPVYTWSLGRVFHKALQQKTLPAGDAYTWQVSFPAETDAGQRLLGSYTLRIELRGTGVRGFAAEVPIRVLVPPTPVPVPVPVAPAAVSRP